MKKNFLFAIIAGLAVMTGCSKNEVIEDTAPTGQDKMEFAPVVGKQTRAGEITSSSLQVNGTELSLYNYKTANDFGSRNNGVFAKFFDAQPEKLTYNGSWNTAKDYEWTELINNNFKLSIFTYYSPSRVLTGITEPTSTAAANFEYTVPNTVDTQEDLLVAARLNMTKVNTKGIIAIDFKHALSQLYFRAKLSGTGYKAVIKSIKVLSAANKGKFSYIVAPTTPATVGTWSTLSGAYNYIYVENTTTNISSKDNAVRIGDATKGSLMLMPQPAVAGTFQFEVTYDVYDLQGALIGSKIVKSADMAALEMGKKYAYTLIIPASENDKISFDVAVSDWDDTSGATEREIRFDEYTLNGTTDAQNLADLITGYAPTVIYLQEVMVTGEINTATTIDLTRLSTTATVGSKVILDCSAVTGWSLDNKVSISVPANWSADVAELAVSGKITITKN